VIFINFSNGNFENYEYKWDISNRHVGFFLAVKKKEELDLAESRNRVQKEAVLLTINEIGNQVTAFLKKD
jgi:hypothetical protein